MARLSKVKTIEIVGYGSIPIKESGFQASGEKREHKSSTGKATDGGFVGELMPATLKATVLSHSHVDAQELGALTDVQINVTMQSGAVHIMPMAFAEETPEDKEGEFEITFISNTSQRIN